MSRRKPAHFTVTQSRIMWKDMSFPHDSIAIPYHFRKKAISRDPGHKQTTQSTLFRKYFNRLYYMYPLHTGAPKHRRRNRKSAVFTTILSLHFHQKHKKKEKNWAKKKIIRKHKYAGAGSAFFHSPKWNRIQKKPNRLSSWAELYKNCLATPTGVIFLSGNITLKVW